MPGGIQPNVVSGSVNTQMWDNIQSALTVKYHSHPRAQAQRCTSFKKCKHTYKNFQFKYSGRLGYDSV